MKFNKLLLFITSLIILLPIAVGAICWNELPSQMASHWGIDGNTDTWMSRAAVVFGLPVLMLMIHWVCIIVTALDRRNKDQNRKAMSTVLWIIPVTSLFANGVIYAAAYGKTASTYTFICLALAILFMLIGNYMPKCKQNRTLGVKIWWTFNSEENWNRTHRFTGKVWVLCGVAALFCALLPEKLFPVILTLLIFAAVIPPTLYSYLFYRKEVKEGTAKRIEYNKKHIIIGLLITVILIAAILFFLLSGEVSISYEQEHFTVEATYCAPLSVSYDSIITVEHRSTNDAGLRTNGFGSIALSLGHFKNDDLGSHLRYCHNGTETSVVVKTTEGTVVISMKTEEENKAVYEKLSEKLLERIK